VSDFDDASLVLIPSGYKNGKVYSVKPTDGTGDLTFTRASSATRVQSDGLIEKVRTNLALYSEDQTNWTVQNQTNVTANAAANPLNGAVTADKVIPTVVTDDHYRGLTMATMVGEITASIYVKADGYSFFDFGIFSNTASNYPVRAIFNLSTQAITYVNGSVASITSVGSGWYRVSITGSVASSSSIGLYHRVKASTTTGTYSGDNTSGMLLWGCQLESGVMTDYIGPTTTAAVSVGPVSGLPRLDYLGSTCPRLLLEPQRTNLAQYSEQFDNAYWTKSGATITANATTSPDGYVNADKLVENSSLSSHYVSVSNLFTVDGSLRAWSLFVKEGERRYIFITNVNTINSDINCVVLDTRLGVFTNTNDPTLIVTRKVQALENGWYRIDFTSAVNNGAYDNFFIGISSTSNMSGVSYLGDGTSGLYIWGAQLEVGAYATSYIPTLSASVTRVADAASKTGISSLIGQTEGTFYAEWEVTQADGGVYEISLSDGSASNAVRLRQNSSNTMQLVVASSGAVVASISSGTTIVVGQRYKLAAAYKLNDFVFYLNGTQVGTDSLGAVPITLTSIATSRGDGSSPFYGELNQSLVFKTRLTNAQLAELTAL
jgi:hypothetical protein